MEMMKRAMNAFWQKLAEPANLLKWVTLLLPVPKGAKRWKYELACPEGWSPVWFPIWSFDNPSIHGGNRPGTRAAFLGSLGLPDAEAFPLPAHSSDIHKVVEHTHDRGVRSFETKYYQDPHILSVPTYKRMFQEGFEKDPSVASPEVIEAGVRLLVETMAAVAVKKGGEIPKRLR